MCDNCWFYTLSAIPQTLGAIIALTATFVVFKMNYTENRTQDEHREIKTWIMLLLPDLKIDEITKLNDDATLFKLQTGLKRLDLSKGSLGFGGYQYLSNLYENLTSSFQRSFRPNEQEIYDYLVEKERIYRSLIKVRKNSLKYLFKSVLLVVITIIVSLLLLPMRELIISPWDIIAVNLVIGLTVVSISYTVHAIRKIAWPQLR